MKPVMLYTLPRTRATVLFYSCRRAILKDEVFANFKLDIDDQEQVKRAFYKIEDPNTVLKIHGSHIARSSIIEDWYHKVIEQQVYDVFVVERPDRLNTFLSLFLAGRFGFNKRDEVSPFEFSVTDQDIELMRKEIKDYLEFYPTYGKVISLENYPSEYFDSFFMNKDDQKSYKKYQYIKNFDWTVKQIETVLQEFASEWQHKINKLNEKNN